MNEHKKVGLDNIEQIKNLSHSLKKHMKDKGLDVSNAILLETLAKSLNYKDWNTLVARIEPKSSLPPDAIFEYKTYIHVDNGGYIIALSQDSGLMRINTSFFSDNTHYFHISPRLITELIEKINKQGEKPHSFSLQEGDTTFNFKDFNLTISNPYTSISIGLSDNILRNKLLSFLMRDNTTQIYPLTQELLVSMAMRLNHAFGLIEDMSMRQQEMNYVEQVYHLLAQGQSDEQISLTHSIAIRDVAKLREEVEGEGFYKPKKTVLTQKP